MLLELDLVYSYFLLTYLNSIFQIVKSQQSQEWTWLGGDNDSDQLTAKDYPGGRSGSTIWVHSEAVYMFGGNGFSDISTGVPRALNDFWLYDIATGKFKLLHPGSFTANATDSEMIEIPESRHHAASCSYNETLFMFGGFGKGGKSLSDSWTFDLKHNKWTKLLNMSSAPSSRGHSGVWCYNFSLYLFGGIGDKIIYNDLWVFNMLSLKWDEVYGSKNLTGLMGNLVYPLGRNGACTWVSNNVFYLFGGNSNPLFTYTLHQSTGLMSDLWKYYPETKVWFYVSGPLFPGHKSVMNGIGTTVDSNLPGSRISSASWTDSHGHLWLFGGAGNDDMQPDAYHTRSSKLLADLWRFHVKEEGWAFMGGSKSGDIQGKYDKLDAKKHTSYPGARTEMMVWKLMPNRAVIFGGVGHDGKGIDGYLNDLWSVDFSEVTENDYLISTLSLLIFVGLGTFSLVVVLIILLCLRQPFSATVRRLNMGHSAKYSRLINEESMF
ncbi:hypothetical protein Bpfe_012061 [Biomphalaria pfeifferi]|uniref:Uncharacterized protein n=1 Tax=Biomphalaria pfeifferi TaxID=112525 RepID=A0AAD8BRF1_BIOPF|nr:hypothetical protein Bpfe_012061 [Biomphalaria pfeifferi]